jgi:thioredoxin-dependent peroxiredoxin
MISVNQTAPDFTLPRDGGESLTLSALRPKKVVLYFYPKDDTSGCTLEAQDFTAKLAQFHAANCEVIGVSKDSVAAHDKFCKKYGLGIVLVSDAEGTVCEDYGVWKEKSMYGKTYMGIERTTVLIDAKGEIAQIWPKVKVKDHAAEVLAAVQAL